jgi:hypothetical protein
MWGQGLAHADKFAVRAANRIAAAGGQTAAISLFSPRSGAKLSAASNAREEHVVRLPSGATRKFPGGDRYLFYDTYPALFGTDTQVLDFFGGRDEEVGRRIFAEVPSTFPTIDHQIASTPVEDGRLVDLLIIDGSVNDVGLEEVLNPEEGSSLDDIDRAIRKFAFDRVKNVLKRARARFPNAVIVVTGYYSPFTADTDRTKLIAMFKFMSDRPGWQLWLNDFLTTGFSRFAFPLALLGSLIGEDLGELADQAVHRSEFAHTRGLFWLRKAVAELFDSGDRRPGIFFAHPGFRPEHGLFAGGTALLHEGYRPPGEGEPVVRDAVLDERVAAIPRVEHLPELHKAIVSILRLRSGQLRPDERPAIVRELDRLRAALDGPTSLRERLAKLVQEGVGPAQIHAGRAADAVNSEIGRIETSTIASFLHPNRAGARRYADRIVATHARGRTLAVRPDIRRMVSPDGGGLSLLRALSRYGLRPRGGLRAALQHAIVDAIGVELDASVLPAGPLTIPVSRLPIFLRISNRRRLRLNGPFAGLAVIDTFGDLHLGDIEMLALEVDPPVRVRMRSFRLLINGQPVFDSSQPATLGSVRFRYPHS